MLQDAIRAKDFEKAKEIIADNSNPFEGMQDYNITGTFDILIREKAFDVIDAFIEKGAIEMDIYEYDSFNKTIFMSILKNLDADDNSISFLNDFIPMVQNLNDELEGKSLLSVALDNAVDIAILKVLVDNGCDVNLINRAEENLIHQVVKTYTRTPEKGLQYLQFLMDEGVEIDTPNISGKTPLHQAVEFHKNEYIQWLMENGANANAQNKDGDSPFFMAVTQGGGSDKYESMREYGSPDFGQTNNRGESLLYEAIRMMSSINDTNLNLFKLLLEDGADLNQPSIYYDNEVTTIDVLAQKPSDLLKIALDSGQLNVNQKDNAGNTILHKVCDYDSNHEEHKAKETYRKVKLLLAAGADANAINGNEETPMMLASKDGLKTKTVELLLSHK